MAVTDGDYARSTVFERSKHCVLDWTEVLGFIHKDVAVGGELPAEIERPVELVVEVKLFLVVQQELKGA